MTDFHWHVAIYLLGMAKGGLVLWCYGTWKASRPRKIVPGDPNAALRLYQAEKEGR
jgi:hypothetical protein